MIAVFGNLLVLVFSLLGILHISWSLGGNWGFENSLPTNEAGERVLNPKKSDSAIVGMGLLFFATFYLIKLETIEMVLPNWAAVSAGWFISIIFLLRAMGDFKYVGFFKKVQNTKFGEMDSKIYTPLCLGIGILGILIEVI
jgi:hypothetical protein